MKTKLEQLKEKIWKAIPSILELKFGCRIELNILGKMIIVDNNKTCLWIINKNGRVQSVMKNILNTCKILGRPIVWDDIALTLENDMNWFITRQGRIFYKGNEVAIWEWGKLLDQQSEETIDFLCKVILKN